MKLRWTILFALTLALGAAGCVAEDDGDDGGTPSENAVCGNDEVETGEQCDGTTMGECTFGQTCNSSCQCENAAATACSGACQASDLPVCAMAATGYTWCYCLNGAWTLYGCADICKEKAVVGCGDDTTDERGVYPVCLCQEGATEPVCGNNVVEGTEQCDGTVLTGCQTGQTCTADCTCTGGSTEPVCNNGVREGTEQCDGADLSGCQAGQTCTTGCTCTGGAAQVCNNGVREGTEQCDGADLSGCQTGQTCTAACTCTGGSTGALCPTGQECVGITEAGDNGAKACVVMQDGQPTIPSGAADCTNTDCTGNYGCWGVSQTQSVCLANCGTCPTGLTCQELAAGLPKGCLNADGTIPGNSQQGCGENSPCNGNATCYCVAEGCTQTACIFNCSN